jgi:hypothetical protein
MLAPLPARNSSVRTCPRCAAHSRAVHPSCAACSRAAEQGALSFAPEQLGLPRAFAHLLLRLQVRLVLDQQLHGRLTAVVRSPHQRRAPFLCNEVHGVHTKPQTQEQLAKLRTASRASAHTRALQAASTPAPASSAAFMPAMSPLAAALSSAVSSARPEAASTLIMQPMPAARRITGGQRSQKRAPRPCVACAQAPQSRAALLGFCRQAAACDRRRRVRRLHNASVLPLRGTQVRGACRAHSRGSSWRTADAA